MMPQQGMSDIVALATLVIPAVAVVVLRKRLRVGLVVAGLVVIGGWVAVFQAAHIDISADLATRDARVPLGEPFSDYEALHDGTGEHAAVFMFGWLPGAVGTVAGLFAVLAYRAVRARRWQNGASDLS